MARTADILATLRRFESRNITYLDPDGTWPVVWARAKGTQVWDVEGKCYLDLTSAFGVAACGHAAPKVVQAGQRQWAVLGHAMGDVHPHELKARLARELSRLTFERWSRRKPAIAPSEGKTIFCSSGFEAVEAALKTALLATQKRGVLAFQGAYHGLGYGALNVTHRQLFRGPFRSQLAAFASFAPFPLRLAEVKPSLKEVARRLRDGNIGAVLVEPVQGRGGIRVAFPEWLRGLSSLCDRHGALLILDEVFTGFGRTGAWFACEHSAVVPDVICLGKALAGGFPISACVGRATLMDAAWPEATGEAIHTSTFLGHPVGCAMALAQIGELRRQKLIARSARLGRYLQSQLKLALRPVPLQIQIRGLGLMVGVEVRRPDGTPAGDVVLRAMKRLLSDGFLVLPEGEHAEVLALTPPLVISPLQLRKAARAVARALSEAATPGPK